MQINKQWNDFFDSWLLIRTIKIQELFLEKILKYTEKDDLLLELGTGSGHTSIALSFSNRNVISSDINEVLLSNIPDNKRLCKKNIDMFDICKNEKIKVDCIFHQGLMEHFSDEEIILSLKEQAKVSKFIIFDVPNDKRLKKTQEFGNERFLSVKKWKSLIADSGLQIVEVSGRRFSAMFRFLPQIFQQSELIRRIFGTSSIFVCKMGTP